MSGPAARRLPIALAAALVVAGLLAAYLLRSGLFSRDDVVVRDFVMDTLATVRVPAGHRRSAEQAVAELKRLEKIFDRHDSQSEVALVNRNAGRWVEVGPEMVVVLALVEDMTAATGGLFDVTVAPLLDLWGFGADEPAIPEAGDLDRVLRVVDGSRLELDREGSRVRLATPGMAIDLGGVAKGYAIDRAVQLLVDRGVTSGLVEVGGDLHVIGERRGGGPWRVGVQHPRDPGTWLGILHLRDQAAATSGDYQRFFEVGGERYHHILDPRTGWPGREAMSVTVVGPSVAEVDLLATAVFLMGPERGLALLEGRPATEGIIVDAQGNVLVTSGLLDRHQVPFFQSQGR